MPLSPLPPRRFTLKGSSFEADLVKKVISSFFPRLLMVILAPRKFFWCLPKVKKISSFLHYRNYSLSSTSSLSPPTLESLMHALIKWTAGQWRLIYSNKKYKKAREIQAKWPNRATTSFLQGSSSSFHRWFSVCIPFFKHTFSRNAN